MCYIKRSECKEEKTDKKTEYYVIICGYCIDGESGIDVIGVKENLYEAKKVYQEQLEIEKRNAINNNYDTIVEDELYFSACIDGDYLENHIDLYIS